MKHFEDAKDKVMMGTERKSLIISEKEKNITSYHEIGHVLVARKLPEADPVHKVTIIPRGRALGLTTYLPIDEKHTYSKTYLETMITYALGGRAAEKIIFKALTTGAGNDIERATEIARKMVCEWGMSDKLGPLSYGQKEEEIFLGRQIARHKNYSEETAIAIDDEIKKIVMNGMKRAEKILSENMDTLHRLAAALLEREILDGAEIDARNYLLSNGALWRNPSSRPPRNERAAKRRNELRHRAHAEGYPHELARYSGGVLLHHPRSSARCSCPPPAPLRSLRSRTHLHPGIRHMVRALVRLPAPPPRTRRGS